MVVNVLALTVLAGWVLWPANTAAPPSINAGGPTGPGAATAPPVPTKADVMSQREHTVRFGLSSPDAPYSRAELDALSKAAGSRPTMIQFFVKWNESFPPDAVEDTYAYGALPVLSWEPWAGMESGVNQPKYALAKITSGAFDPYIIGFATAVRAARYPIAVRFAHEMNGGWYPWSQQRSGNHMGDFVKAWRHVHDVFTKVGATNVIWIWSPNILRPVPRISLAELYPGDAYVDWVGMVGYDVKETTASAVFQPTMTAIRKFTRKPFVITETGSQPGLHKAAWITNFFAWLLNHPDVIGFIWFEYSKDQGGSADWRFTETAASLRAFRAGIARLALSPIAP